MSADNIGPITITFIFLGSVNDIDFLLRFGECSRRWVVGGIGATIDIDTVNHPFAAGMTVGVPTHADWSFSVTV
jgi:hypothetical protein